MVFTRDSIIHSISGYPHTHTHTRHTQYVAINSSTFNFDGIQLINKKINELIKDTKTCRNSLTK